MYTFVSLYRDATQARNKVNSSEFLPSFGTALGTEYMSGCIDSVRPLTLHPANTKTRVNVKNAVIMRATDPVVISLLIMLNRTNSRQGKEIK